LVYKEWKSDSEPTGLKYIDHGRECRLERVNTWVKFYEEVMGFVNFLSFDKQNQHRIFSLMEGDE
jgi:4-hydroxyphenylpyruvate dioxygenase